MKVFSKRFTVLSKVSGLLSLLLVMGAGVSRAETPLTGGGNPPMPPSALSAQTYVGVGSYVSSPWYYITGTGNVITALEARQCRAALLRQCHRVHLLFEAPMPGGGYPPMPPSASAFEAPMPGGGYPPMPPSASAFEAPMPGGGYPPMPPSASAFEAPMPGGGYPPMPPSASAFEAPMPGGGYPPMPPSASAFEAPMPGGGYPPMPPSVSVAAVIGGVALYTDGTIGYPNGDFQFTSGAYLWADGFVRFSSAPGDFVWTNYAGSIIVTSLGDVAANGLPHVEYPTLLGLTL